MFFKPDEGTVTVDGMAVFENEEAKRKFFYISDEQYFFSNATPVEMMEYYRIVYPGYDESRFHSLMKNFGLDEKRKINTFSKGMKKQLSVICGICSGTEYLFCDETFDGLDPVMRQAVKSIFCQRYGPAAVDSDYCFSQFKRAGGYLRSCGTSA
mgnify:CR=1 FL=1